MTTLAQWLMTQTEDVGLCSVVETMAAASAEIAAVLREAPIAGQTGLAGHTAFVRVGGAFCFFGNRVGEWNRRL